MYKVRVLQEINDRLDAEYYNPAALSTLKKMETKGTVTTFGDLVDEGYRVVYHGTDSINGLKDSEVLPFLSPTQIDANGSINFEDADKLPLYYKDQYPKGLGKAGEILVEVKGNVSKVGIVPSAFPKNLMISGSLYKATLNPRRVDSHYVLAFLKSKHGQILKNRLTSNTIINYIAKDALYSIPVIELKEKAQKYIGDKIRQAEQLRAWAKRLERSLDAFIDHFQPEKKEYKKLFSRVPNNLLTNMLTATTYRERYISNQKNLKAISRIQPISYYLSSITNGYDERNEIENGLPYVKVANVRAGYIDLKNTPRVRLSALTDASSKQKPEKGDLLLTRKGSFGIAAVVMESASFLCSSEIFSCKPSKPEFMPILSWFLNSEAGNMQFWQFSTGTTMPGINQENLQNILIPDFSACDIEQFNSIHKNRYEAKKNAELLTDTAKTLVEALIEGQLAEQQLIQAQQALEDGDNSLDQAILSKLSAEGYAIEGATPLFSDVDELYSLLEEAAQAEAEE